MSWVGKSPLTPIQRFCMNILKCGPMPRHIAFIMDGNRRYAKKQQIEQEVGHSRGFDKLSDCLQWCLELGVSEITVYAFSIENFGRSKEEVDNLMELAKEKFIKLLADKLMENEMCIRVIGNLSLLPSDIRKLIAQVMVITKENDTAVLNIAFSYTSREEITSSIETIVQAVKDGKILVEDISEDLISHCLYTSLSPNPDLLIRTSGEIRLSDFLLWQISNTQIHFTEVLWPEFSIWHFFASIFKYQRHFNDMVEFKKDHRHGDVGSSSRVKLFLCELKERMVKQLEVYTNS